MARHDERRTTHIAPEVLDRLDREAEARGVSRSWLAAKLLEEGLDRLLPASEFRLTAPRAPVDTRCQVQSVPAGWHCALPATHHPATGHRWDHSDARPTGLPLEQILDDVPHLVLEEGDGRP